MPTADLPAAKLFYETAGEGPPVLLIGGTWGDLRAEPGPFAWPGAERFTLAAFDHRDLGRSTAKTSAQPTMADFAGDALALADHLGWDRFGVLGISFGGMVAQELALAAGERIDRLALVSTSTGGPDSRSYPLHELYDVPTAQRAGALAGLLDVRARTTPRFAEAIAAQLRGDPRFAMEQAPSAGLVRQLEARRSHDTSGRIGGLRAPTLVVAGRYDGIAPLGVCEALAGALPDSRLVVLEGGHGNGLLMQDPAGWELIADFLAGEAGLTRSVSAASG
jgi:3-oxoadipate enol-lactonase